MLINWKDQWVRCAPSQRSPHSLGNYFPPYMSLAVIHFLEEKSNSILGEFMGLEKPQTRSAWTLGSKTLGQVSRFSLSSYKHFSPHTWQWQSQSLGRVLCFAHLSFIFLIVPTEAKLGGREWCSCTQATLLHLTIRAQLCGLFVCLYFLVGHSVLAFCLLKEFCRTMINGQGGIIVVLVDWWRLFSHFTVLIYYMWHLLKNNTMLTFLVSSF